MKNIKKTDTQALDGFAHESRLLKTINPLKLQELSNCDFQSLLLDSLIKIKEVLTLHLTHYLHITNPGQSSSFYTEALFF